MPNVETHPPGTFCWIELGTTDQNAAKQFYSALFGWSPADFPMGPNEYYTMFNLDGRNTGACYTLNAQMRSQGIPPHWMVYVCVSSADETAAKVEPAGGKLNAAPFDVMEFGRMAVIQDPAGAHIAIWQPKMHHGTGISQVPGTLCWGDLMTPSQAAAARFYEQVFGWKFDPGKDDTGYLHIKNGDEFIGGVPPAEHVPPGVPPHWLLYFLVENCDASTDKARQLGAHIHMPPMSMEGVGRWSVVADPQGAALALFQPLPHQ